VNCVSQLVFSTSDLQSGGMHSCGTYLRPMPDDGGSGMSQFVLAWTFIIVDQ